MTEQEWMRNQACSQWLLNHLWFQDKVSRTKAGKRRVRLFACGCCRLIWEHLHDSRLREAVQVAERFADGQATKQELKEAVDSIRELVDYDPPERAAALEWTASAMALYTTAAKALEAAYPMTSCMHPLAGRCGDNEEGEAVLCNLLREVFGNPFRPISIHLAWQTSTVLQLASAAYDERQLPKGTLDPTRLAVLADALEESGCTNADILSHLRGSGPHVRGCWALDLILMKT